MTRTSLTFTTLAVGLTIAAVPALPSAAETTSKVSPRA